MAKENISELKTEYLVKKKKTILTVTGMLAGMLVVLFIMGILLSIKKGFSALVVVPFGLLPIVILNYNEVSKINKELTSRNPGQ